MTFAYRAAPAFLRAGLLALFFLPVYGTFNTNRALAQGHKSVCNVRDYGALGDGKTLDTRAINNAIQDCHAGGGGIVRLGPGTYLTGTIYYADNVTLDVQAGATILASSNLADYPRMTHASEWRDTSLIIAENVNNIGLVGKGTIDGNGRAFISARQVRWTPSFDVSLTRQGQVWEQRMAQSNEGPVTMGDRPGVLFVALHVKGLTIKDIHVLDSPNWTIKIGCSSHIRVKGLDVRNNMLIPNNDALDISTSSDAVVEDSYLQAGDDALVIGGPCLDGWCEAPAEHIRVHNVTLLSRSAALRIGPAFMDVRDIKVDHVRILKSNRGILIQTRSLETLEQIDITDVNIQTGLIDGPWWGGGEPISISVAHCDYVSWQKVSGLGTVRHVHFARITSTSDSPIVLWGFEPGHIQDVSFDGLALSMVPDALNPILGGNLDLQPTAPVNFGVRKHDLPAILVHGVDDLRLKGVQVKWLGAFPDFYTNAILAEDFNNLTIKGFRGSASPSAAATLPAIQLRDGQGQVVQNARTTAGPLLAVSKSN